MSTQLLSGQNRFNIDEACENEQNEWQNLLRREKTLANMVKFPFGSRRRSHKYLAKPEAGPSLSVWIRSYTGGPSTNSIQPDASSDNLETDRKRKAEEMSEFLRCFIDMDYVNIEQKDSDCTGSDEACKDYQAEYANTEVLEIFEKAIFSQGKHGKERTWSMHIISRNKQLIRIRRMGTNDSKAKWQFWRRTDVAEMVSVEVPPGNSVGVIAEELRGDGVLRLLFHPSFELSLNAMNMVLESCRYKYNCICRGPKFEICDGEQPIGHMSTNWYSEQNRKSKLELSFTASVDPRAKALMVGAALLIDYMRSMGKIPPHRSYEET